MKLISMALSTVFLFEIMGILVFRTIIIGSSSMCETDYVDGLSASSYVDPSDMGSYSHSLQKNVGDKCLDFQERSKNTAPERTASQIEDESDHAHGPCKCEMCRNSGEFIYTHRLVGSILRQMNVQSHHFGPRESITINLQAELAYEDLSKLNSFLTNASKRKFGLEIDPQYEIRWTTELAAITDIVGNLFHVVHPQPAVTLIEYLQDNVNFQFLSSIKFWVNLSIGTLVIFLVILLVQRAYMSAHPFRTMLYSFGIFYVISCVIVFYDLYENAKAENLARLNQYEKVPKDCNYNDLGFTDSVMYYIRVHVFRFKDQCADYHKQIRGDNFFHVTPIEAISETLSRFLFHPMEYIGERLGKFFGGLLGDVPWILKPFLLVLICTFVLLAIFRYRIRTPFISIEPTQPTPRRPSIYDGNRAQVRPAAAHEAITLQPPRFYSDSATSTDDFEEYLKESALESQVDRGDS